jgi:hypothetical protein
MEPSGRNRWQPMANEIAARTARIVRTGDELVLTVTVPPQAADALRFMFPAR